MGTKNISTRRNKINDRTRKRRVACACGCGTYINEFDSRGRKRKIEKGHNARLIVRDEEYRDKVRKSVKKWHETVGHSEETKNKIRKTLLAKRGEISRRQMGKGNSMYGKTHSEEYKKRLSIEKKGARAWNWKGGITYYRGEDWEKQRKLCYKRDKYTCQVCKIVRSKSLLAAHHLISWDKTKDNRLENLITLCLRCHGKKHGRGKS